ncbi:E3 ubiquitin-protein ligase rnf14, partial [Globomyces sp. JEL0801]
SVELVCCPDEQCKKLAKDNPIESGLHHLTQSDLEKILSNDMLDRYYELYHEHSLQARADIIHCPRPSCQYPNLKPSNKDEKLIICITCGLCCNVWHGYGANCKIKNSDFILQTYLEGDESIQTDLKLRYGHSIIEKLVKEYQDLQSTLDWVKNNTQQCPVLYSF